MRLEKCSSTVRVSRLMLYSLYDPLEAEPAFSLSALCTFTMTGRKGQFDNKTLHWNREVVQLTMVRPPRLSSSMLFNSIFFQKKKKFLSCQSPNKLASEDGIEGRADGGYALHDSHHCFY